MHCTVKKRVQIIIDQGHHYVITVKMNQPKLCAEFEKLTKMNPISTLEQQEKLKGRKEQRNISVYSCTPFVIEHWAGATRMIIIKRRGLRKGHLYENTHYYISSVENNDANYFAQGIREHWSIENKLHWVKDVQMNEDGSRIRHHSSSQILSIFKAWALNIYRVNGFSKWKPAIAIFGNRLDRISNLLRT